MKNSRLVFMTIIGFSAALVASESQVETVVTPVVETVVTETTPSYADRAQASYNDFVAFSSEQMTSAHNFMNESMTEASVYAQANPVIASSVATAAVVTIAGISYYAYTQCGTAKKTEVEKN